MNSDNFTAQKFAWLDQVCVAPESRGNNVMRVAFKIAERINRETREAWPSVATLATELSISEQCVRDAVRTLEDHGHLAAIRSQGGSGVTNRYRWVVKRTEKPSNAFEGSAENPQNVLGVSEAKTLKKLGKNPQKVLTQYL